MYIREYRNLNFIPHPLKNTQSFFEARAPITFMGGTIGFIERAFIDEMYPERTRDLPKLLGRF